MIFLIVEFIIFEQWLEIDSKKKRFCCESNIFWWFIVVIFKKVEIWLRCEWNSSKKLKERNLSWCKFAVFVNDFFCFSKFINSDVERSNSTLFLFILIVISLMQRCTKIWNTMKSSRIAMMSFFVIIWYLTTFSRNSKRCCNSCWLSYNRSMCSFVSCWIVDIILKKRICLH